METLVVYDKILPETAEFFVEVGTTLGGYYLALKNKFNSEAHLPSIGTDGYELLTTGSTATQYAITNVSTINYLPIGSSCNLTFTDPTMDLIASARELMFRTALGIAVGNNSLVQTVSGLQFTTAAVYESQYVYLGIAVVLTGIAVFLVTLTFTGYSTLGRSVSMSPLETAKAFNAPILDSADSNADVNSLMQLVGEKSVRYGAVLIDAAAPGFGGVYAAGKDGTHATSAYIPSDIDSRRMRLGMAEEGIVQMPRKGWKFSG
jgi:hypothetical protein